MNRLTAELKRFVREEEGTEVVEWALVVGLIVAVAAGVFVAIGNDVRTALQSLADVVSTAAEAEGGD